MSHELLITRIGTAQLERDGVLVWASDADPDFAEDIGSEYIAEEDIGDALDYLIDLGYLNEAEADACDVTFERPGDDEDDDEEADPGEPGDDDAEWDEEDEEDEEETDT